MIYYWYFQVYCDGLNYKMLAENVSICFLNMLKYFYTKNIIYTLLMKMWLNNKKQANSNLLADY